MQKFIGKNSLPALFQLLFPTRWVCMLPLLETKLIFQQFFLFFWLFCLFVCLFDCFAFFGGGVGVSFFRGGGMGNFFVVFM